MSHSIAIVNLADGTVQAHKAGCADLSRGTLRRHASEAWNLEVDTRHEAWVEYNIDFLEEGPESGQYEITWLPCAKHVPQGEADTYETWAAGSEVVEETKPVVTHKRGPKWSYIFVDGVQVAEVRSNLLDPVLATIIASL